MYTDDELFAHMIIRIKTKNPYQSKPSPSLLLVLHASQVSDLLFENIFESIYLIHLILLQVLLMMMKIGVIETMMPFINSITMNILI